MRVAFRLFIDGEKSFEEIEDIEDESQDALEALAEKHMMRVLGKDTWLVEVELIDLPDDPERFLRFGTDSSMMVSPISPDDPTVKHPWEGSDAR